MMRELMNAYVAKLKGLILRAVVSRVDEGHRFRLLQLQILADDEDDEVEHVEPYGYSARPVDADADGSPESIIAALSASADQNVALVVADRRYRPQNLQPGEVVMYDASGQVVKLMADRIEIDGAGNEIHLGAGATKGVNREGDNVLSNGAIDAPFFAWVTAVALATSTTAPTSLTSRTQAGSSIVKAVD